MTIPSSVEAADTVGAIAKCRYVVLKRADELLRELPDSDGDRAERLPGVSGLLMTSLEELKVAEEELRDQNAVLAAQRAAVDERVRHYRQLFLHLPTPAFITDIYATIREANLAAGGLFRREARHLERKPLSTLLATEHRDDFRRQLSRVTAGDNVREWHLIFKRVGDIPVDTQATVCMIPDIGPTRSGLLYWLLTVKPTAN